MRLRILALAAALAAGQTARPADAVGKVLDLFSRLASAQQNKAHVRFQLTETEVNTYAAHALRATPRPGVRSVIVKFFPQNYVSTFTVIDFDAIEKWKPGTVPTLLRPILRGQRSVWLDYRFRAADGKGTFSVEKAYFQNVRLPAFFVQSMIQAVAARQPEHYDTSKPVPLPFGLRRIWTSGQTVCGEN